MLTALFAFAVASARPDLAACEQIFDRVERAVHVQAVKAGIPQGQRKKAAQKRAEAACQGEVK